MAMQCQILGMPTGRYIGILGNSSASPGREEAAQTLPPGIWAGQPRSVTVGPLAHVV